MHYYFVPLLNILCVHVCACMQMAMGTAHPLLPRFLKQEEPCAELIDVKTPRHLSEILVFELKAEAGWDYCIVFPCQGKRNKY